MECDFELERLAKIIKEKDAMRVLLQFPDGLKPKSNKVVDYLEKHTNARILIWGGSCFGACDLPLTASQLGVDLIVQFGHSKMVFKSDD